MRPAHVKYMWLRISYMTVGLLGRWFASARIVRSGRRDETPRPRLVFRAPERANAMVYSASPGFLVVHTLVGLLAWISTEKKSGSPFNSLVFPEGGFDGRSFPLKNVLLDNPGSLSRRSTSAFPPTVRPQDYPRYCLLYETFVCWCSCITFLSSLFCSE
jgi:hypothetical protein